jgi:polysaccharide biosynthesis protein PslH
MNILYLCHRIPFPPDKGEKIRSFHQIKHLSERHNISLACLVDRIEDLQGVGKLKQYCASVDVVYRRPILARAAMLAALPSTKSLSVASFYSRRLQSRIDRLLSAKRFDVIYVFSSAMAEYVWSVQGIPKIMDFVDVDSEKWFDYAGYYSFPLSLIFRQEGSRLARLEERIASHFDHSIFVSEMESSLFKRRLSTRPISVIPNGVDIEYFKPPMEHVSAGDNPILIFIGAMDYFPNIDAVIYFCNEIFPLVRKKRPGVQLHIVGGRPVRRVKELSRHANVKVTGWVPDVRPYLAEASISVAPFRIARGLQNKILEAMASGVPVISTSRAVQGIKAGENDGLRIADEPSLFAEKILRLLDEPQLRMRCAESGLDFVRRNHRWEDSGLLLEELLLSVTSARQNTTAETPTQ